MAVALMVRVAVTAKVTATATVAPEEALRGMSPGANGAVESGGGLNRLRRVVPIWGANRA